ncbi:transglutaminase domain-containing protein [Paenibacillus pasadenensis]|uniref:transglutaminase-like domain-containing protein n=1 Tax=Paenibacillus pasadenensis TaxID=217090 RepID=UPI000417FFE4|nr:transglutaminase-like domain-containing protein [Paenibacillus pasadenensis]
MSGRAGGSRSPEESGGADAGRQRERRREPAPWSPGEREKEGIARRLEERRRLAAARERELFGALAEARDEEEAWALRLLLASMPVGDLADYDGAMLLEHARQSLAIRRAMPWGGEVPDELFAHFVLPYRINTEDIDGSRGLLHAELAPRVQGRSMEEAILETNYWCHEKATYAGSDLRTASPLTTIRAARGRCGEESTLAVAALRSVGIPARQVYTPRWAHCDDNHAWVEAWADGRWRYFGACEPEARLDQGWFTPPARRAMLVDTRVFGGYAGSEETTLERDGYAELNLLATYAPTRVLDVSVREEDGSAAAGAQVRFELYNMAELHPIAVLTADADGRASLRAGLGTLLVRAAGRGGRWDERLVHADSPDALELRLARRGQPQAPAELDFVPPPERDGEPLPELPEAALRRHEERLREGSACRGEFEAGFLGEPEAAELARASGLPAERLLPLLAGARGNGAEIAAFLGEQARAGRGAWALRLVETLSAKDRTDALRPTLEDHLLGALAALGEAPPASSTDAEDERERFDSYVLCPRVLHERLAPYRGLLAAAFSREEREALRLRPAGLAAQLERRFALADTVPNLRGKGTPAGAWRLGRGDRETRDILLVALYRSLGIPARLQPGSHRPAFWQDGWREARFADEREPMPDEAGRTGDGAGSRHAELRLAAVPGAPAAVYGVTMTLARLQDGVYRTLAYPHGSTGYEDRRLRLEPGEYRLTTGTRLKDGTALARLSYAELRAGELAELELTLRSADEAVPVLGELRTAGELSPLDGGAPLGWTQALGEGAALVAWLEPEREPSRHLLRELAEQAEPLQAAGAAVLLLLAEGAADGGPRAAATARQPDGGDSLAASAVPAGGRLARERGGSSLPALAQAASAAEAGCPHLFVVDAERRIRYASSGYRIGAAKEALETLAALRR